jgi:hypothetical protein
MTADKSAELAYLPDESGQLALARLFSVNVQEVRCFVRHLKALS